MKLYLDSSKHLTFRYSVIKSSTLLIMIGLNFGTNNVKHLFNRCKAYHNVGSLLSTTQKLHRQMSKIFFDLDMLSFWNRYLLKIHWLQIIFFRKLFSKYYFQKLFLKYYFRKSILEKNMNCYFTFFISFEYTNRNAQLISQSSFWIMLKQ